MPACEALAPDLAPAGREAGCCGCSSASFGPCAAPESRCSHRIARKTTTKAARAYPATSAFRLSITWPKLRGAELHLSTCVSQFSDRLVTGASNHAESAAAAFKLLLSDLHFLNLRASRARSAELDHGVDCLLRALEDCLDGAVGAVGHGA